MPAARDSKEWAASGGLHGIGNSLYTPEVAVDEGRAIAPDTVIQACTSAVSAKDCLELTQHAEAAGADICYLQTPPMEVHGGEGVLRFFQYIADRTDIALGMFNSASSGYVLTPEDSARIANAIPAVCATKEGTLEAWRSKATHALAPEIVIRECDAGCRWATTRTPALRRASCRRRPRCRSAPRSRRRGSPTSSPASNRLDPWRKKWC